VQVGAAERETAPAHAHALDMQCSPSRRRREVQPKAAGRRCWKTGHEMPPLEAPVRGNEGSRRAAGRRIHLASVHACTVGVRAMGPCHLERSTCTPKPYHAGLQVLRTIGWEHVVPTGRCFRRVGNNTDRLAQFLRSTSPGQISSHMFKGEAVYERRQRKAHTRVHLLSAFLRATDPMAKRVRSELPQ
jgi:hypothetical protein